MTKYLQCRYEQYVVRQLAKSFMLLNVYELHQRYTLASF